MKSPGLELTLHIIEVLAAIVVATFAVLGFLQPAGSKFPDWGWTVLIVSGVLVLIIGGRLMLHTLKPVSLIRSYVEPYDASLGFSPKFRLELRNDSGHCLDFETSRWIEGKPLVYNTPRGTWQVYREGKWSPSPNGDAKLHAHPGELVRTWMVFKDLKEAEVENARQHKWLGKLEILANGKPIKYKV